MDAFRVHGVDRETGEREIVDIQAVNEKAALDAAYQRGLVVEKIEHLKANAKKSVINSTPTAKPKSTKQPAKLGYGSPWGDLGGVKTSGNRVLEIAIGVFLGLLLFSCISPMIVIFVLGFLRGLASDSQFSP
jgi:hypothetical protein